MDERRATYLAGEAPGDVLMYLSEDAVDDADRLASEGGGERVEGGTVVVVDGERGRRAFTAAAGSDPMRFAGRARDREGHVDRALTGGTCPDDHGEEDGEEQATDDDTTAAEDHHVRYLFSFAEAQQPEGDGIYAEGDVIHAYVQCSCGVAYSDRWVVGEESE